MRAAAGAPAPARRRPGLLERWLKRRTRLDLPLTLGYRQIFILPTRFGWMLGLLMAAMLIGSLNFNNNLGLLTTFLVAATAVNSLLLAYRNLHGLKFGQAGAAPVHAGETASYRLTVNSAGGRDRPGLRLVAGRQATRFTATAGRAVDVAVALPTRTRGWHDPGRMRVETTVPLGLFRAWSWIEPSRPFLVWPQPATSAPPLPAQSAAADGRESRQRDVGEEFHSLRRWREGDPLHRVAWKATQRHQALLSREFRELESPDLLFDLEQAPGRDLERRISILTAWVLRAQAQQRGFTLQLGSDRIGPGRGPDHAHRCLRALAEL